MVHQHFALAESLTVLENVVLGTGRSARSPRPAGRAREAGQALMRDSGLDVASDRRVSRLAVGERQRVEILKVLYRGARILVLDEPTAVLTPQEVDGLFGVLRRLAAERALGHLHLAQAAARCWRSRTASRCCAAAARSRTARPRAPTGASSPSSWSAARSRRAGATPRAPGAPLLVLDGSA